MPIQRSPGPDGPPLTRRSFVHLGLASLAACALPRGQVPIAPAASVGPRPTPAQLAWQRDELAMFLHFGVNTFTDREWGDGREDPAIFAPARLDAMQWARAARDRFPATTVRRVRLRIEEAVGAPGPVRVQLFGPGET